MRSFRHGAASITVLFFSLAAVGCGAESSPTPSSSTVDPASAAPTPTLTRPSLGDLVLTPEGLGDVRIGLPVPDADPALATVEWNANGCADDGGEPGSPWTGYWHSIDMGITFPSGEPIPAFVLGTDGGVKDGAVNLIRVHSDVRTAAGIGIGATRAELEAAYPSPTAILDRHGISTVYVLEEGGTRLTIELANEDTGDYWRPGEAGHVLFMWASTTEYPASGIAGGDGGGPCRV